MGASIMIMFHYQLSLDALKLRITLLPPSLCLSFNSQMVTLPRNGQFKQSSCSPLKMYTIRDTWVPWPTPSPTAVTSTHIL